MELARAGRAVGWNYMTLMQYPTITCTMKSAGAVARWPCLRSGSLSLSRCDPGPAAAASAVAATFLLPDVWIGVASPAAAVTFLLPEWLPSPPPSAPGQNHRHTKDFGGVLVHKGGDPNPLCVSCPQENKRKTQTHKGFRMAFPGHG